MHAPNPLIALGVMASTALTDAVYVLFNSAVSGKRRFAAANLEQHLVSAVRFRRHKLHRKPGLRAVRCRAAHGSGPSSRSLG